MRDDFFRSKMGSGNLGSRRDFLGISFFFFFFFLLLGGNEVKEDYVCKYKPYVGSGSFTKPFRCWPYFLVKIKRKKKRRLD